MRLYNVPEEEVEVIYEGVNEIPNHQFQISDKISDIRSLISNLKPYLLFVGRLEKRKNIEGIISAFEILKDKYKIPHKLVLAGREGYGFLNDRLQDAKHKQEIILPGFVSDQEKWELMKNTDVFLFPTFYEGFGLPVLEAQHIGTPVVTSNISSLPEVGGDSVAYCDPEEPVSIADSTYKIIKDKDFRDGIIEKGYENVKRFSWENCASEVANLLA